MSEEDPEILKMSQSLASSGFRDTSRVGGGNPELGLMMAKHNKEALRRSLYTYRQKLDYVIEQINEENWITTNNLLYSSQSKRSKFL